MPADTTSETHFQITDRFDAALRERVAANMQRFERRVYNSERNTEENAEGLRPAGVAVTLIEDEEGEPCFVLTRRAAGLRKHAGQWALPGGRLDEGEDATTAALRELSEEVGLELSADSVLGLLDDYPTRSGYIITPVVVWAEGGTLTPNPGEVDAVFRVRLAELLRPDVPQIRRIPESDRPLITVPLLGVSIHAPTAAILFQLREVALRGRSTRVAHFDQPVFAWS